jgi:cytochrome c2
VKVPVCIAAACMMLTSCDARNPGALGGDIENGRLLLRQFGCGGCHDVPGVAAAQGRIGPPLGGIGRRVYLAGVLPNTPENMADFIRSPARFEPRTAMPDLGVTQGHARDMVAYLYTLR